MRILYLALAIGMFGSSCAGEKKGKADDQHAATIQEGNRYSLKSGVMTYETQLPQSMGSTKRIMYFDDYGRKEKMVSISSITAMGQSISQEMHVLTKDGFTYSWSVGDSSGMKVKVDSIFDPSKMDYEHLSEEVRTQMNLKEEGTEEVNGKKCTIFSMDYEGIKGKVWVWNNIPMKTQATMMGFNVIENLVSLEENVDVPASHFVLPDIIWQEMSYDMPVAE
jgi:hypothetical protein